MSDAIGWMATALTASSYFTRRQALLRRTQACAAALWLVYGAFIHSMPVMTVTVFGGVRNDDQSATPQTMTLAVMTGMALWSSFRTPPKTVTAAPSPEAAVGDD